MGGSLGRERQALPPLDCGAKVVERGARPDGGREGLGRRLRSELERSRQDGEGLVGLARSDQAPEPHIDAGGAAQDGAQLRTPKHPPRRRSSRKLAHGSGTTDQGTQEYRGPCLCF